MDQLKNIIVFLITIMCLSCETNEKERTNNIEGKWSVLFPDSTYFEAYIDSSKILLYDIDIEYLPMKFYTIKDDSLFVKQSLNGKAETAYFIEEFDNKHLVLKNKHILGFIRYDRIDSTEFTFDKIKDFSREKLRYEVSLLNRKNKMLGIKKVINYDSVKKKV